MKPGLRLGIDLGGTLVKLALVDSKGKIIDRQYVKTVLNPPSLVRNLKEAIEPWKKKKVMGTGVGVAGDVNPKEGIVRFSPNLHWKKVPLKKYLTQAGFPKPLYFENDASAAAWGVYHVELKKRFQNIIVLTFGTGIGGGLILNGRLYQGATGTAGELGHVTIDPSGEECGCGGKGCLETFIGGKSLVNYAKKELMKLKNPVPDSLSPKDLYQAAKRGDSFALKIWERAGKALGIGLSGFINIFNPEAIVFVGGVSAASPIFLPYAKPEIQKRAFETSRKAVKIIVSPKDKSLGVIGAALLVP